MLVGGIPIGSAPSSAEERIADLLNELEQTRTERDFYKAAAGKLMRQSQRNRRRAQ
jgi:hypothetical protein